MLGKTLGSHCCRAAIGVLGKGTVLSHFLRHFLMSVERVVGLRKICSINLSQLCDFGCGILLLNQDFWQHNSALVKLLLPCC